MPRPEVAELDPATLVPGAVRLGMALAGSLGTIVVAERRRLRTLARSVLFVRWRTWLVTSAILLMAVATTWSAVVFVAALSVQGARELARLAHLRRAHRRALLVTSAMAGPAAVAVWPWTWPLLPLAAILCAGSVAFATRVNRGGVSVAIAASGFVWIAWPLGAFLLIRDGLPGGPGVLLAVVTAVAASDVGAFTVGTIFGRHRLAPRISPNKTWEGVAGNVLGALAGLALMSVVLPAGFGTDRVLALGAVIGIACLLGDLFESMVKRRFVVKDTGTWLPGFGGLLDRIDSLLVALPLTYGFLRVTA
jgi:phosphatidate cytidylyltransferase